MFVHLNQVLAGALATSGTLLLTGDFDEFRLSPANHVMMVDDVRYTAPTDFTISSDGSGDLTLTWLNVATIASGKTLRLGIAYIDLITGGTGAGGGGGDATAAKQDLAHAQLVLANASLDAMEAQALSAVPTGVFTPVIFSEATLTCDTNILAAGDIIADTQALLVAVRAADAVGLLQSVMLLDEDDLKSAIRLVFFSANVSLGAENAAPSITDANARNYLGHVDIAAADYVDLGGVSVVKKVGADCNFAVKPAAGTDTLYFAAYYTGAATPTYTAAGLRIRVGVIH